ACALTPEASKTNSAPIHRNIARSLVRDRARCTPESDSYLVTIFPENSAERTQTWTTLGLVQTLYRSRALSPVLSSLIQAHHVPAPTGNLRAPQHGTSTLPETPRTAARIHPSCRDPAHRGKDPAHRGKVPPFLPTPAC